MIKIYTLMQRQRVALVALSLLVLGTSLSTVEAQSLPKPDHIIFIIEENQPNAYIIGNTAAPLQTQTPAQIAPYINALAVDTDACVFNSLYAIEHPSQPNYLDLFSGNNQGVLDDNLPANYPFSSPNLAWELLHKGYTFATYSADLPSVGSDVQTSATGSYARKHNPVTNWVGTGQYQVPDTLNQPFSALPVDFSQLPTVSFIVPDEDSDMHNGSYPSTATIADWWMQNYLSNLINWAKANNTLIIYTFDEDDGFYNNNIPTVFIGQMVKPGSCATNYTLYSILRTIEDMYSLGEYAGAAAQASDITDVWRSTSTGINNVRAAAALLRVSPNPASASVTFDARGLTGSTGDIYITDVTGRTIAQYAIPDSKMLEVNTSAFTAGLYFYHLAQNGAADQTGKFVIAHP